jgi:hypothetical protein
MNFIIDYIKRRSKETPRLIAVELRLAKVYFQEITSIEKPIDSQLGDVTGRVE